MRAKPMSRSLFISLFALATSLMAESVWAQSGTLQSTMNSMKSDAMKNKVDEEEEEVAKPKVFVSKDNGLALGIDLSPIIMRFIEDERTGVAFIGRYGIARRLWANAEAGYENIQYSNDNFEYKSNGSFVRIGVDYDIFNREDFPTNDNIFIGLRYAYAWQMHECEEFTIVDSYWGDYVGHVSKTSVNTHSLDLLFGLRCEVLSHFYMGWSFRARFKLYSGHNDELDPYAIVGYGSYDSGVNMGFTYTLEYQLPRKKK